MAEYIERMTAIYTACKGCNKEFPNEPCEPTECNIQRGLFAIPAADVVEVRHGEWLSSRNGINPIRCDKCNMPALFVQEQDGFGDFGFYRCPSNYCPYCGAKMDGKGE